ncbi:hypothetical protein [Succinivibrio sp.]|uniref:hypothetical protein n=1 Tax=Succinivibrio sp. TaxID=2053619 RepID=UPI00386385CC
MPDTQCNIVDDYLSGKYSPKNWFSIHNCWFLNGQDKSWYIRFFRESLFDAFYVCVVKNNTEVESIEDTSIYASWDALLIKVFGLRFSIVREKDSLVIFRGSNDSKTDIYGIGSQLIVIKKKVVDKIVIDKNANNEKKCANLVIHNRELIVSQTAELIECSSCRLSLIYILARSYVYKLEEYVRKISENPNIANKTYIEMQQWKTRYMFVMPLQTNRVGELFFMWEDLYSYFGIDQLIKEMEGKLKEISLLENSKKLDRLNSKMLYLTIFATVSAVVSCSITLYDIFR